MTIVVAAALTIVPAVVAIGGPTPMGGGGPGMVRACDPERTTREPPRISYELEPLTIQPVIRGPRHRGAIAYRRTVEEIAAELNAPQEFDGGPFRACYRWARWAKPELAGDLSIGIEVDEWGHIARVAAATDPVDADVSVCFSDVLAGMRVGLYTPRRTVMQVTFRLQLSGQARPNPRPARPARPRPEAGDRRVCAEQPVLLPRDVIDDHAPLVVVDDFSKEQADQEKREKYRAEMRAWTTAGRHGPAPKLIPDVIACGANVRGVPRRAEVEMAVGFQRGDFEACYAEASRRGYHNGGEVGLVASVNRVGQFEAARVAASTTKDAVLDRCLARALAHAQVATGPGGAFQVHVPVRLAPGYAPIPFTRDNEDFAGDAVDNGDDQTATVLYGAALGSASAPRRCAIAVGALQAALTTAPWQEDERVSAAVDGVRDALRAAPSPARPTCRKLAMPLLAAWATHPFQLAHATRRSGLMVPAADRMQRLLAFDPPLPIAPTLRALREVALQVMTQKQPGSRCCGGGAPVAARVAELQAVIPDPPVGAMEIRDALIYLRSLRIAGQQALVCREASAVVAGSWNHQMRLLPFKTCLVPSDGVGSVPPLP